MTRKTFILILFYLSWVFVNVHRIWNNSEPVNIKPFPLDPDYPISWHWYVHFILKDLSYALIFLALYLYISSNLKKDKEIRTTFFTIFTIHVSDITHFLLWARHSEHVLTLQGIALIITYTYNLFRKTTLKHGSAN